MELPEAVALAQQLDDRGFEQLFAAYQSLVLSLVTFYVGSPDAADVAQEVWLRVYQKIWQLEDGEKFVPWLRQVVFYHCLNYRKARARRRAAESYLPPEAWLGLLECVADDDECCFPEAVLESGSVRSLLSHELDQLPGDYGLVLRLYYFSDLSYQELAELTGLSLSTIKWRLYQGRQLLKKRLISLLGLGKNH